MKKALVALPLLMALTLSSCAAGPHQLRRTVDDWDQKMYIENPWIDGVLWFIPVIPIAGYLGSIGDFFTGDLYAFWFKDAWDGKGTGFKHFNPTATDGSMSSLLNDDGKFMEIK
jgi:hypothetical protein